MAETAVTHKNVQEVILESLNHTEYIPKIKALLCDKYGLDAFQYRTPYFLRRISMISKKLGTPDLIKIYDHIKDSHEGYIDFLNTLTIHVTEFFRDRTMWDYMEQELFPPIIQGDKGSKPTKSRPYQVWSAGCSSGEEPYSLAITFTEVYEKMMKKEGILHESLMESSMPIPIKIFASDINRRILKEAQEGIYSERTLKNASSRIRNKYFTKESNSKGFPVYRLCDRIKELVTFQKIDLFKDNFPKRMDLITCRNVVIYFTKEQQKVLFTRFWDSLNEDRNMITGKSELLPVEVKKHFKLIKLAEHVYEKADPTKENPKYRLS